MASKRGVRRKACDGKIRHTDKRNSLKHLISLKKEGGVNLNAYRCKFCKGWHIGHYR